MKIRLNLSLTKRSDVEVVIGMLVSDGYSVEPAVKNGDAFVSAENNACTVLCVNVDNETATVESFTNYLHDHLHKKGIMYYSVYTHGFGRGQSMTGTGNVWNEKPMPKVQEKPLFSLTSTSTSNKTN